LDVVPRIAELDFANVTTVIDIARGAGVNRVGLITERSNP